MVRTSVLNDALNAMNNAEKAGKRQVLIHPSSKVIVKFLSVMQKHGTWRPYSFLVFSHGAEEMERGGISCSEIRALQGTTSNFSSTVAAFYWSDRWTNLQ